MWKDVKQKLILGGLLGGGTAFLKAYAKNFLRADKKERGLVVKIE